MVIYATLSLQRLSPDSAGKSTCLMVMLEHLDMCHSVLAFIVISSGISGS